MASSTTSALPAVGNTGFNPIVAAGIVIFTILFVVCVIAGIRVKGKSTGTQGTQLTQGTKPTGRGDTDTASVSSSSWQPPSPSLRARAMSNRLHPPCFSLPAVSVDFIGISVLPPLLLCSLHRFFLNLSIESPSSLVAHVPVRLCTRD